MIDVKHWTSSVGNLGSVYDLSARGTAEGDFLGSLVEDPLGISEKRSSKATHRVQALCHSHTGRKEREQNCSK